MAKTTSHVSAARADGTVLPGGGRARVYKADGGCDQATVGTQYAEQLKAAGVEVFTYEKSKPTKVVDGSVQDLITGFCVTDIGLVAHSGRYSGCFSREVRLMSCRGRRRKT